MEPTDQHSPKQHAGNYNCNDRISELPDPILHHILSTFTTRDVVEAGLLSKRYRNLWISIPNLSFDHGQFGYTLKERRKFRSFVDAVLLQRSTLEVDKFFLKWQHFFDQEQANIWICHAVRHNVKVLRLIAGGLGKLDLKLPNCMFNNSTIEVLGLSLYATSKLSVPEHVTLGRIRRLHLYGVDVPSLSQNRLFSGCPVLEVLHIRYCKLGYDPLVISSNTLKTLVIMDCALRKVQISIPSLISLYFDCTTPVDTSLENLSSLINASIYNCKFYYGNTMFNAVKGLYNATNIKLYGKCIELPSGDASSEFSTFHNLKSLTLSDCLISDNLQGLVHFLRQSPNLEILTLNALSFYTIMHWELGEISFDCPHLRLVKINCAMEHETLNELVKFLKENLTTVEMSTVTR